jgi:hypothetical protein
VRRYATREFPSLSKFLTGEKRKRQFVALRRIYSYAKGAKGVKSFVDSQRQHRGVTNKPTHVGIGRVVSIGESEKVNIFFLQR